MVRPNEPADASRSGQARYMLAYALLRVILDSKLRLSPRLRIVKAAEDDLLGFTAGRFFGVAIGVGSRGISAGEQG